MNQYEVNIDDGDDTDEEPPEIPDDGDKEEEMNYYGDTQIALTQPVISRPYDWPDHFTRLNLDAMTLDWSFHLMPLDDSKVKKRAHNRRQGFRLSYCRWNQTNQLERLQCLSLLSPLASSGLY
ncbi:hypothetical protein AHAS_Ahas01G0110400 [Arachis hypogaea]